MQRERHAYELSTGCGANRATVVDHLRAGCDQEQAEYASQSLALDHLNYAATEQCSDYAAYGDFTCHAQVHASVAGVDDDTCEAQSQHYRQTCAMGTILFECEEENKCGNDECSASYPQEPTEYSGGEANSEKNEYGAVCLLLSGLILHSVLESNRHEFRAEVVLPPD